MSPNLILQPDSSGFMSESRQLQRQFPKPTKPIVEQILAHILAFGEDEDSQELKPQCLID